MSKSAGAQAVCTGLFDVSSFNHHTRLTLIDLHHVHQFGDANAYMHLAVTANNLTAEDMQNDRISQIVSSARLRKEVPVELACSEPHLCPPLDVISD